MDFLSGIQSNSNQQVSQLSSWQYSTEERTRYEELILQGKTSDEAKAIIDTEKQQKIDEQQAQQSASLNPFAQQGSKTDNPYEGETTTMDAYIKGFKGGEVLA